MKLDIENLEQLKQFSNKKKFRNKHPLTLTSDIS